MIELDLFWSLFIFTRLTDFNRVQEKKLRKYNFVPGTVYLSHILSLTVVTRNHSLNSLLIFAARNSLGQVERPHYETVAGVPGLGLSLWTVNCALYDPRTECAWFAVNSRAHVCARRVYACAAASVRNSIHLLSSESKLVAFRWKCCFVAVSMNLFVQFYCFYRIMVGQIQGGP